MDARKEIEYMKKVLMAKGKLSPAILCIQRGISTSQAYRLLALFKEALAEGYVDDVEVDIKGSTVVLRDSPDRDREIERENRDTDKQENEKETNEEDDNEIPDVFSAKPLDQLPDAAFVKTKAK